MLPELESELCTRRNEMPFLAFEQGETKSPTRFARSTIRALGLHRNPVTSVPGQEGHPREQRAQCHLALKQSVDRNPRQRVQVGGVIGEDMAWPRRDGGDEACPLGNAELARPGGGRVADRIGQMPDGLSQALFEQRLASGNLAGGNGGIMFRKNRVRNRVRANGYVGLARQLLNLVPAEAEFRVEAAGGYSRLPGQARDRRA